MDNPGSFPDPAERAYMTQAYGDLLRKYKLTDARVKIFLENRLNAPDGDKLAKTGC